MFGAGGHSKDLEYLSQNDKYIRWNLIGFLDDNESLEDNNIIGTTSSLVQLLQKYNNLYFSIGINSSSIRKAIANKYQNLSRAANLIHDTAVIGTMCTYQNGLTMGPYSVLTTRVDLGQHVHINTLASINQSSRLGDFCTVSPGARICGDVSIGECTSVGAGSTIINFKNVGSDCILGAGTVVIDNIDNGSTVVGVPGREIKRFGEYI